jgi:hypothetical protein
LFWWFFGVLYVFLILLLTKMRSGPDFGGIWILLGRVWTEFDYFLWEIWGEC